MRSLCVLLGIIHTLRRYGQLRSIPPTVGFGLVETLGIAIAIIATLKQDLAVSAILSQHEVPLAQAA